MKLNINSNSSRSLNKKHFIPNINNNNSNLFENKTGKIYYCRNNAFNEYELWKTHYSSNDRRINKKYINSNINSNSIIKVNNIKEKHYIKRPVHSASLIKKLKVYNYNYNYNYNNHSQQKLIHNKHCNLRQIHEIISFIEKKLNLLHNINRDNNGNYLSDDYIINRNIFSSINSLIKKNNQKKNTFHINKTIYKYKNQSFLNENININNIDNNKINSLNIICPRDNKINKSDLIPFPYKRLQKKIRKYFSLTKKIKLSEDQFPFYYFSNKFFFKNEQIYDNDNNKNNNNHVKDFKVMKYDHNDNIHNDNNDNNHNNHNNNKIIKKEDKSVNTEDAFLEINSNNLKKSKIKNKKIQKCNYVTYFDNKFISSMNNSKKSKFFITTSNNKNKNFGHLSETHRAIYVYQKND